MSFLSFPVNVQTINYSSDIWNAHCSGLDSPILSITTTTSSTAAASPYSGTKMAGNADFVATGRLCFIRKSENLTIIWFHKFRLLGMTTLSRGPMRMEESTGKASLAGRQRTFYSTRRLFPWRKNPVEGEINGSVVVNFFKHESARKWSFVVLPFIFSRLIVRNFLWRRNRFHSPPRLFFRDFFRRAILWVPPQKLCSFEMIIWNWLSHTICNWQILCRWFRFAQLAKGKKSRP